MVMDTIDKISNVLILHLSMEHVQKRLYSLWMTEFYV